MCCSNNIKITVIPKNTFSVKRKCQKCKDKTTYKNTDHFRINANGSNLDIWMIYQCETCKSTYNLSIYERIKPDTITVAQYQKFMENDKQLIRQYGLDRNIFKANKAEIQEKNVKYNLNIEKSTNTNQQEDTIQINNPSQLKIRIDKIISEQLNLSRDIIKKMILEEKIKSEEVISFNRPISLENIKVTIIK